MAKKVEGYIKLTDSSWKGNTSTTRWTSTWTARCKHCTIYKRI